MADSRDAGGRFAKGASGNKRGRPPKRHIDPKLPAARRDVIARVADRMVDVKVDANGKVERLSLYEANVYQLAIAGARGNRVSSQKFIELCMAMSERDLLMRVQNRAMIDHMNKVEDELNELRKRAGQRSGVVQVSMDELEAFNKGRFDERNADELLGHRKPGGAGE